MEKKIAIIDYGFGNIKSVLNGLSFLGVKGEIISLPEQMDDYGGVILPGVGAFAPAIMFLKKKGFDSAITNYLKSGKLLYGICLGFQLLLTKSYENGEHKGLNLIEGEVKKFQFNDNKLKVPHMGWNNVQITETEGAKKMFDEIQNGDNFYFVHSYYVVLNNNLCASSFCNYDIDFCSSIAFNNIWGSQFHLEKSGNSGLKVLKNFIKEVHK
jgi:glutamine amidotransferase